MIHYGTSRVQIFTNGWEMSAVILPVSRSTGYGMLVGRPGNRAASASILNRLGFGIIERDDPYAAMAAISGNPSAYHALFLDLRGLFREELAIISAVKSRYPHIEVWLSQTEGRQASLNEAMRLGGDGLLTEEGLHRLVVSPVGTWPAIAGDPTVDTAVMKPVGRGPLLAEQAPIDHQALPLVAEQHEPQSDKPTPPLASAPESPPVSDADRSVHSTGVTPSRDVPTNEDSSESEALMDSRVIEPLITAEELRALLQEPDVVSNGSR